MPSNDWKKYKASLDSLGLKKWPILALTVASCYTTAAGIASLFNLDDYIRWSIGLSASIVCQSMMIIAVLDIVADGPRARHIIFYVAFAIFSMTFSYISTYKLLVLDYANASTRTKSVGLFEHYRTNVKNDLSVARNILAGC